MASTFKFLSGSLALENKPFHLRIAEMARTTFTKCHGYIGYKLTTLGRASEDDVPSFLILTREHGVVLLDIVEDRVHQASAVDGVEYWRLDSGNTFPARTLVI